ncbi:MAG: hypothetical protein QW684_07200, partial [Candidatus Nitrosocaldus sp.]
MQAEHGNKRSYEMACMEIAKALMDDPCIDRMKVKKIIKAIAGKYLLPTLPKNSDILACIESHYCRKDIPDGNNNNNVSKLDDAQSARLRMLLMVKPSRTASGVAVISVMPKPYPCPHGRCIYCPGGVEVNIPNSYTSSSPATIVAMRYGYDPYMQIRSKLDALARNGHYTS